MINLFVWAYLVNRISWSIGKDVYFSDEELRQIRQGRFQVTTFGQEDAWEAWLKGWSPLDFMIWEVTGLTPES